MPDLESQIVIDLQTGRVMSVPLKQTLTGYTELLPEMDMKWDLENKDAHEFCVVELPNKDMIWVEPIFPDLPNRITNTLGEC